MSLAEKTVLVLGGGIAGATAALNLVEEGVNVIMVEQDDFIGGYGAHLACKALESCQSCNGCLVEPRLASLLTNPEIKIYRRGRLTEIEYDDNKITATISQRPAFLDPVKCIACGECEDKCPAMDRAAIRRALMAGDVPMLAINPRTCLQLNGVECTVCRDVCPTEAIDFDQAAVTRRFTVDSMVVATGFKPYPAEEKPTFGYGTVENVITALELEEEVRRTGQVRRPSDGEIPKKVAFIQCVGSRDLKRHNYCSRVCCGYALRLGRMLHHRFGIEVSVFYMDIQSFGHAFDEFLAAAKEELKLIRFMPSDVMAGEDGQVLIRRLSEDGGEAIKEPFDLVVLSIGIAPNENNRELADKLGLELDEHGFMAPDRASASPTGDRTEKPAGAKGIFLAGTALRPMDVAEVVAQAGRAAQETIRYLEEG